MKSNQPLRTIFDDGAALYDAVRPGYPDELIEDVVSLSGMPEGGRVLEIGCGTGQATLPFARRGYAMLCLDAGRNMAALAAEKCRPYPNVRVLPVSFEDWPLEPAAFDLVISATAFHWISPEIGYSKAVSALRNDGALAVFWNMDTRPRGPLFRALQEAYRKHVPELAEAYAGRKPCETLVQEREGEMRATGLFRNVAVKRYPWSARYSADEYLRLLSTYSDHCRLPEETKRRFFDDVARVIDRFGGVVVKPYLSVCYIARKK